MFPWISLRKSILALIGCSFLIGIICMYLYYNLIKEKHVLLNLTLNGQVGKGLKGFAELYVKSQAGLPRDFSPTPAHGQPITEVSGKNAQPSDKDQAKDNQPPKVDRFSAQPINSTLAMPLIEGTEYFDAFVRRKYLSCRANISRDTNVAYGKCRNFTNMHFIDGSRLVAMPSFPGSGSTWARTALEQATGIYTGSVYCDNGLKSKGFAGEWVVSANVLTVKTHLASRELFPRPYEFHDPNKYKGITAVILLVRNPLESFISKWHFLRSNGSHVAIVEPNDFGMYHCDQ